MPNEPAKPTSTEPPLDEIPPAAGILHVSAMYGYKTRQPRVILTYDAPGKEFEIQLSIAEAFNHAQDVMETAHSATTDGFLFEFLVDRLGTTEEIAAQIMSEYRVWRQEKRV